MDDALAAVLRRSQRIGFLGARPIADVIEHARSFVAALDGVNGRVVDLGSGGGVPGLVIACDRPDLEVTMIDRRRKRTDFLEQVTARLGITARTRVIAGDVTELVESQPFAFDAVVARGFGPPDVTLRMASGLVRSTGRIIISEPPDGDRWDASLIADLGLGRRSEFPHVAVFERLDR